MVTANDHRITFLNSIRSKAGIERHAASEEILHLMSGNSLLRKSSEILLKSVTSSPVSSDGTRSRSSSERIPKQNSRRRQSTMSLPSDLEFMGVLEEDIAISLSRSDSLTDSNHKPSLIITEDLLDHHDERDELDLPHRDINSHTEKIGSHSHSETIPLFEHFLVIGASVDVSGTTIVSTILTSLFSPVVSSVD
jgi:hypothetical protein